MGCCFDRLALGERLIHPALQSIKPASPRLGNMYVFPFFFPFVCRVSICVPSVRGTGRTQLALNQINPGCLFGYSVPSIYLSSLGIRLMMHPARLRLAYAPRPNDESQRK